MEEDIFKKEKKEREITVSKFSVFAPRSARTLYEDYPELKEYNDVFKALSTNDLLFVWYYANETSPLYNILNPYKRADECIKLTYSKGLKKIEPSFKEALLNAKFPDNMKRAIDVMSKFRVGPRLRAKIVAEKIFENLERILDIDASDDTNFTNKEGDVDWAKKKAYMDTSAKAIDIMPTLIKQIESSFSVTDKKKTDNSDEGDDDQSYMDTFHEQKN